MDVTRIVTVQITSVNKDVLEEEYAPHTQEEILEFEEHVKCDWDVDDVKVLDVQDFIRKEE